jgi:hypothetical protein
MFWTFQPRPDILPTGVLPFITWDWQDKKIDEITNLMLNGGKLQIGKSREVGATWIVLGCGLNLWLWTPRNVGMLLSRKEECVDAKGDPNSLFWKLKFMLDNLPEWAVPEYIKTDRHLENLWNNSVIGGESTNVSAGKSGRVNWTLVDEFPEVPIADARMIESAISDTSACNIFLGTAVYRSHPFTQMGTQKGVKKMFFGWWLHPFKAKGLYWSPDINKIVIEDIDCYRNLAPEVFKKYQKGQEIKYSDLQTELFMDYPELKISFVADGGKANKPKWRSPWYDTTCLARTEQDIATNLDGNAIGSGDMVFHSGTLNQMLCDYVKEPDKTGEVIYNINDNKVENIKFIEGGHRRLKWWGVLGGVRPLQNHNYVMGCDISLGQGQSNSVCSIFDVDERKKVGIWADSNTLPSAFAEQVYAIGKWVGGMSGVPLLNFESNGIGQVFLKRLKEIGYEFICKSITTVKGFNEKKTVLGWVSNQNSKLQLLSNYNAAMTACFQPNLDAKKFINPDEESIREAEDYIFNGSQITPSKCIEDTGGAKMTHGDKVIADALCNLAAQEQPKAAKEFESNIEGSFEWRKKRVMERKLAKENRTKIWLKY